MNVTKISKRELIAQMCFGTGLLSLLEHAPQRKALLVLNYHRVGNASDTPFDRETFSASSEAFDEQVTYLKRHFHICTIDEALAMVKGEIPFSTSVLLTFDDGYVDHYTVVFPILRSHGVPATFFIPTAFIGTARIPWWDNIAYVIAHSRNNIIQLTYPKRLQFDLAHEGIDKSISQALWLYKSPEMTDHERFLRNLQAACEATPDISAERLFVSWRELQHMQQGGMAFGSHSHSHDILAKLSFDQQATELRRSRLLLEKELHTPAHVLAYPVGLLSSFNQHTWSALRDTGYEAAFSFYGGFNRAGTTQAFDIRRVSVNNPTSARFRLQTSVAAMTARTWF